MVTQCGDNETYFKDSLSEGIYCVALGCSNNKEVLTEIFSAYLMDFYIQIPSFWMKPCISIYQNQVKYKPYDFTCAQSNVIY